MFRDIETILIYSAECPYFIEYIDKFKQILAGEYLKFQNIHSPGKLYTISGLIGLGTLHSSGRLSKILTTTPHFEFNRENILKDIRSKYDNIVANIIKIYDKVIVYELEPVNVRGDFFHIIPEKHIFMNQYKELFDIMEFNENTKYGMASNIIALSKIDADFYLMSEDLYSDNLREHCYTYLTETREDYLCTNLSGAILVYYYHNIRNKIDIIYILNTLNRYKMLEYGDYFKSFYTLYIDLANPDDVHIDILDPIKFDKNISRKEVDLWLDFVIYLLQDFNYGYGREHEDEINIRSLGLDDFAEILPEYKDLIISRLLYYYTDYNQWVEYENIKKGLPGYYN